MTIRAVHHAADIAERKYGGAGRKVIYRFGLNYLLSHFNGSAVIDGDEFTFVVVADATKTVQLIGNFTVARAEVAFDSAFVEIFKKLCGMFFHPQIANYIV